MVRPVGSNGGSGRPPVRPVKLQDLNDPVMPDDGDGDGDTGKRDKSLGPPGLMDRLKEQAKKRLATVKEKLMGGRKLLKGLTGLNPADLAKALGPALTMAGAIAGVGAAVALPLYAIANEREDERQIERPELERIEAGLDDVAGDVDELPQFDDIPEPLPETPTATPGATVPDLSEPLLAIAERVGKLEGVDVVESPELEALTDRIERLTTTTGPSITVPPVTSPLVSVDLGPLESSLGDAETQAAEARTAASDALLAAQESAAAIAELQTRTAELDAIEELAGVLEVAQAETDATVEALTGLVDEASTAAAEAAAVAEEALEAAEPFDPADLEAADAANLAAAQQAAADAAAAQAEAEAAQAEAMAAADEIAAIDAELADVQTVFFAQLEEDYSQGVPIAMEPGPCVSGTDPLFLNAPEAPPSGNGISLGGSAGTAEGCREYIPAIPDLPAACSFPDAGSGRVRLVGSSGATFISGSAGTANVRGGTGVLEAPGASFFGFVSNAMATVSNPWDVFQFWAYDGTRTPYFQLWARAETITPQVIAAASFSDATFTATIECDTGDEDDG